MLYIQSRFKGRHSFINFLEECSLSFVNFSSLKFSTRYFLIIKFQNNLDVCILSGKLFFEEKFLIFVMLSYDYEYTNVY